MRSVMKFIKSFFLMEIRNRQAVITGTLLPILMLILMGTAGSSESREGMSYMTYILPGILGMSYASTGLIAFPIMLSSYRENGFLKFIKVTPVKISKIIFSLIITQIILMFLQTLLVLVFCNYILKLGLKYSFPNIIWLSIVLVLSAISLVLIGLIISILSKNVKNTSVFGNLGNLLSTFLGGAFFPTDVWPQFLQPLVKVNPLTHMIAMLRSSLIYNDFVLSDIWNYTFYLVLMIVVCFVISFKYFTYEA